MSSNVKFSDAKIRLSLIVLSIIGLLDSAYLAYIKLADATAACAEIGDCDAVNSSQYAEIGGIPIALLGAGAYVAMIFLVIMEKKGDFWRDQGPLLVFMFSLIGVLYSAYLTYIEIWVLYAVCPYCVLSAIVLVLMLGLSVYRFLRGPESVDA